MFAWNARPPHPKHVPNWKEMWLGRLNKASAPWVNIWLSHQLREEYWKPGSICEDPQRVQCPVLAIGKDILWCR